MAAIDPKGNQKYWCEGQPYQGVKNHAVNVGEGINWINGQPEENVVPKSNQETGKFFLMFE